MRINLPEAGGPIKDWILYEVHGLGVKEAPLYDGRTLGIFNGTKREAAEECLKRNVAMHGPVESWSSWESPTVSYKEVTKLN